MHLNRVTNLARYKVIQLPYICFHPPPRGGYYKYLIAGLTSNSVGYMGGLFISIIINSLKTYTTNTNTFIEMKNQLTGNMH